MTRWLTSPAHRRWLEAETDRLLDDARRLFDAAVREGWSADGTDGFVSTVDWQGKTGRP